jgi:hypothetical protein
MQPRREKLTPGLGLDDGSQDLKFVPIAELEDCLRRSAALTRDAEL